MNRIGYQATINPSGEFHGKIWTENNDSVTYYGDFTAMITELNRHLVETPSKNFYLDKRWEDIMYFMKYQLDGDIVQFAELEDNEEPSPSIIQMYNQALNWITILKDECKDSKYKNLLKLLLNGLNKEINEN